MKDSTKIIGLTGTNGAGKGEAAAFFQSAGFAFYSLSDLIREEIRRKGLSISRNNLIKTGNALRERYGADILARWTMKKVLGNAVIDSIRNTEEIAYLRTHANFILLAIDAPAEIRFARTKKRGRDESAANISDFLAKEAEEMAGGNDKQQLQACMQLADHTIQNNGTLEDFFFKLKRFL